MIYDIKSKKSKKTKEYLSICMPKKVRFESVDWLNCRVIVIRLDTLKIKQREK